MTPAGKLRNAAQLLRDGAAPGISREMATPIAAWLDSASDDLASVDLAADMYQVDPLTLVDEPDSVRSALAVERVLSEVTS